MGNTVYVIYCIKVILSKTEVRFILIGNYARYYGRLISNKVKEELPAIQ
jgi:hypothetical protein